MRPSGTMRAVQGLMFVVILAVLPLVTAPGAAAMTADKAVGFIDRLGSEAFAILQQPNMTPDQREQAFGQMLHKGFNLDLIARFVIGNHWHRATPRQREDYLDVFDAFVIKTYARRLGGFTGTGFAITGTFVVGNKGDIIVETRIDRRSGPPIRAGWRVREANGVPKIIDIVVEGVSMVVTQRQEFAAVTRRGGIDGLVHALRAQTEKLSVRAG